MSNALHFRTDGPDDAPPLLLINGLFADLHSWDPVMSMLSDFRVLRYDGPGQGQSPKPLGAYDLTMMVDALFVFLNTHNWPPTFVVGLSHGGSVALEFARRFPERVRGIVAADCHTAVSPLMRCKLQSWLRAHQLGGPLLRFDVATPWIWSESILQEAPGLVETYRAKAAEHPSHAVVGLIQSALSVDIPLNNIHTPALLLVGAEDLLTPPFVMKEIHARLPQSSFQIVRGGHASLLEHPSLIDEVVRPQLQAWLA